MPGGCYYSQTVLEDLLLTLSPLLERQPPSREMCTAFSRHCRLHPRSSLVRGLFTSVVHRILKHNVVSCLSFFLFLFITGFFIRFRFMFVFFIEKNRILGKIRLCDASFTTTSGSFTPTTTGHRPSVTLFKGAFHFFLFLLI